MFECCLVLFIYCYLFYSTFYWHFSLKWTPLCKKQTNKKPNKKIPNPKRIVYSQPLSMTWSGIYNLLCSSCLVEILGAVPPLHAGAFSNVIVFVNLYKLLWHLFLPLVLHMACKRAMRSHDEVIVFMSLSSCRLESGVKCGSALPHLELVPLNIFFPFPPGEVCSVLARWHRGLWGH